MFSMLNRRFSLLLIASSLAFAGVTRVEVTRKTDLPNGYEQVTGKAYFAVDPKLPANKIIADIDLAPSNPKAWWSFRPTSC